MTKGTYQSLKDVQVYRLARRLVQEVWEVVATWDYFGKRTVGEQLVRAVDSISANIAESYGRHHMRDVVNFLYYVRGSLYESQDWISKAIQRQLLPKDQGQEFLDQIHILAPKLNAYITAKRNYPTT
jgi:four helix bundle protein